MEIRCVYAWINDTIHEPFYVGCGTHERAFGKHKKRSKAFSEIIDNNKCHCVILMDNLSPEEAATLERQVIQDYREQGIDLVNQTNGGEIRQFSKWTAEMRKEYAERLTGTNNPNYGNKWTKQQKEHLSKVRIEKGIAKGAANPRAKPVMCVETGEIFLCQQDAKEFLGVASPTSSIWHALKDPKHVVGKGRYHFVGEEMFDLLSTEEKRKEWLEKVAS